MSRRVLILGCAVVLAVSVATTTRAASIVYTASATSDQETWGTSLTVSQFDPNLGVLQAVGVVLRVTGDVRYSVTNPLADSRFADAMYGYRVDATIGNLDSGRFQWLTGGFGLITPQRTLIPGNTTLTLGPTGVPVYASDYYTSSADLAALTGLGLLNLSVGLTKNPGLRVTSVPEVTYGLVDINRLVTFEVTYVYHTPEPSSLALAGIGVAGLLGACWRRRRRVAGC